MRDANHDIRPDEIRRGISGSADWDGGLHRALNPNLGGGFSLRCALRIGCNEADDLNAQV
jgi:hypothetical protein